MTSSPGCGGAASFCALLDWDSQHFGVRIARLDDVEISRQVLEEVDVWCQANRVYCLYFLGKTASDQGTDLLVSMGYRQMDVRVTLQWLPTHGLPGLPDVAGVGARLATGEDFPRLRELVLSQTWKTRFWADPGFDRGKVKALYVEWVNRSLQDDDAQVMVAEHGSGIVGFVSAGCRRGVGSIDLVCGAVSSRRRGAVSLLVRQTMVDLAQKGCQSIGVVTQQRNAPALELYGRCGFAVIESRPWFHKWYQRETPPPKSLNGVE